MAGRDVALGDRDEAREPRLGGEQIVATRVERALGHPIADREQLAVGVEQKAVAHLERHRPRGRFEGREARRQSSGRVRRLIDVAPVTLDRAARRRHPEQHVRAGVVAAFAGECGGDVGHGLGLRGEVRQMRSRCPRRPRPACRTPAASAASVSSSWCQVTVCVRRPSRSWSVASRARSSASAMPARRCAAVGGRTVHSRQALASAIRWPARFPLSTVETYCGSSGRRSRVSYQL